MGSIICCGDNSVARPDGSQNRVDMELKRRLSIRVSENQISVANAEAKVVKSMNFANLIEKMNTLSHQMDEVELGDVKHGDVYKRIL
jgi:hypothetical protein